MRPYKWLRPDMVLLRSISQCQDSLTSGGSGVLADPTKIDKECRKAWLPFLCQSGLGFPSSVGLEAGGG